MYGEVKTWPDWVEALVHINHFALVVNSSINILIYCCKDEKFLHVMLVTLQLRKPSRSFAQSNNTRGGGGGGGGRRCRVVIEESVGNGKSINDRSKIDGLEMGELKTTSRSATASISMSETPR